MILLYSHEKQWRRGKEGGGQLPSSKFLAVGKVSKNCCLNMQHLGIKSPPFGKKNLAKSKFCLPICLKFATVCRNSVEFPVSCGQRHGECRRNGIWATADLPRVTVSRDGYEKCAVWCLVKCYHRMACGVVSIDCVRRDPGVPRLNRNAVSVPSDTLTPQDPR